MGKAGQGVHLGQVRLIFSAYVGGSGMKTIARTLNEQKRKTPALMQLELLNKSLPNTQDVILSADKLRKYFPRSYTPQKMEETILKLLDAWLRKRQRDQSR